MESHDQEDEKPGLTSKFERPAESSGRFFEGSLSLQVLGAALPRPDADAREAQAKDGPPSPCAAQSWSEPHAEASCRLGRPEARSPPARMPAEKDKFCPRGSPRVRAAAGRGIQKFPPLEREHREDEAAGKTSRRIQERVHRQIEEADEVPPSTGFGTVVAEGGGCWRSKSPSQAEEK